jgi:hypothetical protein
MIGLVDCAIRNEFAHQKEQLCAAAGALRCE